MNKKPRVCIVIPAYNEAQAIEGVIQKTTSYFEKNKKYTTDIVVIDDGSSDKTGALSQSAGVRVISHILNTGAGGATATGLSYAFAQGYDIAATMDGDGQHSSQDVALCIDSLIADKADLLIGSRLINTEGMSRTKVLGNRGLSLITYLLFGIRSTDSQSGLRVFSRNALEKLRWKTSGYEFCSEMLWRASQLHLVIRERPIKAIYTDYSKSKGQSNWNAINIVSSLIKRRLSEILG
jgi:glycosyltransferase involved in cell wall biosynthesis